MPHYYTYSNIILSIFIRTGDINTLTVLKTFPGIVQECWPLSSVAYCEFCRILKWSMPQDIHYVWAYLQLCCLSYSACWVERWVQNSLTKVILYSTIFLLLKRSFYIKPCGRIETGRLGDVRLHWGLLMLQYKGEVSWSAL